MRKIIAALDNSPSASPVLHTAIALAQTLGAKLEAIHVLEDGVATAEGIAFSQGISLRIVEGEPFEQLVAELKEPGVQLGVLGARGHAGDARPAGHVATRVAERAAKPVAVVPPDAVICESSRLRKILLPLDGTEATARAARKAVRTFRRAGVEVVALHVFDKGTTPRFLDRPEHDMDAWTREFLARYCSEPGSRLALRAGRTGHHIIHTADEEDADMIALAWSQDLSPGRAAVVGEALARGRLPLLLLPVVGGRKRSSPPARTSRRSAARIP
jgi:nucleotide-binding universal stress UspA family protein